MENKCILEKISSKYILDTIINYIDNKNKIILKLFIHSKKFQQMLDIKLLDYQEKAFLNLRINFFKYLIINSYDKDYDINILNNNLEKDLLKHKNLFNKTIIEAIIINFFKKRYDLIKNNEEYNKNNKDINNKFKINIISPFFKALSKENFFEKLFTIDINAREFEKFENLKNEYISIFDNLNNSNINYSSLSIDFGGSSDNNYLTEINIDFNKIKKLSIYNNYTDFYEKIFSYESVQNNLEFLDINYPSFSSSTIKLNSIKNLNDLKALRVLYFKNIGFNETYSMSNLLNLEILYLDSCSNITFSSNAFPNLKILNINNSKIVNSNSYTKLIKLEKCIVKNSEFDYFNNTPKNIYPIIDVQYFENLEYFEGEMNDFIYLHSSKLKKVNLFSTDKNSFLIKRVILRKLVKYKTLEEIEIQLYNFEEYNISKIEEKNDSVNVLKLFIQMTKDDSNCIITELQDKFLNLSKLFISSKHLYKFHFDGKNILEIEENPDIKINDITLNLFGFNHIKFYCCPFEDLVSIDVGCTKIVNIESSFPIFNKNCNVIFKALNSFSFNFIKISVEAFINLYNNIDYMPNLKKFYFRSKVQIDEDYYKKFIQKLLSINCFDISFIINFLDYDEENYYSKEELSQMFPNINFQKYKNIKISKFKIISQEEYEIECSCHRFIKKENNNPTLDSKEKIEIKKKNKKCQII